MKQTRMKSNGKAVSWIQSHSKPLLLRAQLQVVKDLEEPRNHSFTLQPCLINRHCCSSAFNSGPSVISVSGQNFSKTPTATPAYRVILHFDLDCFYAQVEMIRNPALREVPLGNLIILIDKNILMFTYFPFSSFLKSIKTILFN